jgi:hypothetical protein
MSLQRINAGKGHWYKLDGKKVDGVTTLLGDGLPKKALMYWSAKQVAEYVADNSDNVRSYMDTLSREQLVKLLKEVPWEKRDRAAVRGTQVHTLAEKLVHGEEVEVPDELDGYVRSCVDFLNDWQVQPVLVEATVASRRWRYAGTLDLVADVADGSRGIFDYKTSESGIWPETILQQAAYRFAEFYLDGDGAEQPVADLGITAAFGVHIRPDGYSVHPLPSDDRAFKDFLHVAWVARWLKGAKGLVGDPAELPQSEVAA